LIQTINNNLRPLYVKGTSKNDLILGFIGRMYVKIKGLDLMLESILKLQKKYGPTGAKFIFVGPLETKSEANRTYIENTLKILPFPEEVIFIGPKYGEDKWRILKSFDIYFQTSRTEGMPNTIVEALACGKPCFVTKGTNMDRLIHSIDAGWDCETSESGVFSFLKSLNKIDREEIDRKGNNAFRFVQEKMTWKTIANDYCKKLKLLL
jgi:glycosyltransferase involved in cell wall biosynthesis